MFTVKTALKAIKFLGGTTGGKAAIPPLPSSLLTCSLCPYFAGYYFVITSSHFPLCLQSDSVQSDSMQNERVKETSLLSSDEDDSKVKQAII